LRYYELSVKTKFNCDIPFFYLLRKIISSDLHIIYKIKNFTACSDQACLVSEVFKNDEIKTEYEENHSENHSSI